MTPLEEFEGLVRAACRPNDAAARAAHKLKQEHGEDNAWRDIRQMSARRRFVYNAAVDPPDQATWTRALDRRVDELRDELLEATAGHSLPAELVLGESRAAELKERLLFQDGAAFVLDMLRHIYPEGASVETKLEFMEAQTTELEAACLARFGFGSGGRSRNRST